MQRIVFATNNLHKLHEIQNLLGDQFHLVSLKEIGFSEEIPETQPTLEGNALQKARHIFNRFNTSCFADDTGLEVESLGGEPGVHSARYSGDLQSFASEKARSEANINKLLDKLQNEKNRKARFRTVIAYIQDGKEFLFEGIINGELIDHRRGTDGFGYDPIFVPDGYNLTFAEMSLEEKNKISHRARAFSKFVKYLKEQK